MSGQINKYKFKTTQESEMPTSQLNGQLKSVKKKLYSTIKKEGHERTSSLLLRNLTND